MADRVSAPAASGRGAGGSGPRSPPLTPQPRLPRRWRTRAVGSGPSVISSGGSVSDVCRCACFDAGRQAPAGGAELSALGDSLRRMTWTAPPLDRTEPDLQGPERRSLEQWLDYHRQTLLWKCSGLTGEQLVQQAVPPSQLTLLGLVRHMAEVERWWFRTHAAGETDDMIFCTDEWENADFEDLDPAKADADLATYRVEVDAARAAVAGKALDDIARCGAEHHHRHYERDLRWIFVH